MPNTYTPRRIALTLAIALSLFANTLQAREPYRIIAYNVENFFDFEHDDQKNDYDFTPYGKYRWTENRFFTKSEQIARVICQAGQWQTALLVGLCEVENENCLKRLLQALKGYPYRFLHSESPDERGIDVALLYDSTRFAVLDWHTIPIDLDNDFTRDLLYAKGLLPEGDTLHVIMCHLPSMRGGKHKSEWKRQRAKQVIQIHTDSILARQPDALIAVMGDMNSQPLNDLKGLVNRMLPDRQDASDSRNSQHRHEHRPIRGTHKYQGSWSCLDQFYLSPALDQRAETRIYVPDFLLEEDDKHLGRRPAATFRGYQYNPNGYSDHLPIILDF